ncbi:hypothetical protein PHSY_004238 [Pseudozyma hubeiensis SY62]|uniref:Uncharacterized protein n=1 Tax=Pseudozyma hubeiensis (strain SY62) TaxID=1305764 RepID=R9PEX8_PSEHS|nr:hypothetical protein PHSY_004238 [Pseudozyma hubeiensis SY62]GAC96655.1 hypothetical protein PHSY_004238 [Pseudozyma hubeiensis SY62]
MVTNHTARTPSTEPQHRYPPATPQSQIRRFDNEHTANDAGLISYIVHTESNGVSDLRLQVSHEASSSKQPLRPLYVRERALTEHDEIVDQIIDANTGAPCWTIHRPTRGWYMYLRSPALPQGTAISFRSGTQDQDDPAATPLTFSLNTRVRTQVLDKVRSRIASSQIADRSSSADAREDADRTSHGLAIHLEEEDDGAEQDAAQSVAVAATGRQDRKTASGGHARRRSGVGGSGTHSLDARQHGKRPSSNVARSPRIPETPDETSSSLSQPPARESLSRLAIPTKSTSSASSPQSSGADRPYSPTLPSTPGAPASPLAPHTSTFLLTNGQGPHQSPATQSWARWTYSKLPAPIRPSLSLDADKSFSLFWLNPPASNRSTTEGVEMARFEDQSGRWMWNSHTRGRLTLQTSALQAVGLQKEFWISAALAYIQFLEDKDAYEAARDA